MPELDTKEPELDADLEHATKASTGTRDEKPPEIAGSTGARRHSSRALDSLLRFLFLRK